MVTGIGGGLGAANIMGMFGQQNTAQTVNPIGASPNDPYRGGYYGIHSQG